MNPQIIIPLFMLVAFAAFAFALSKSIKKYDQRKSNVKGKKRRSKYLPQVKNPGHK